MSQFPLRISRFPLRIRLVAVVLALVFLAVLLVGAAGELTLRRYALARVDEQLAIAASVLREDLVAMLPFAYRNYPPLQIPHGMAFQFYDSTGRAILASTGATLSLSVGGKPRDRPFNAAGDWRVLLESVDGGTIVVAQDLSELGALSQRVFLVEGLIGAGVLIALAALGAAIVRGSLVPLLSIERIAASVAAGDLSKRVPPADPRTEVGRLSEAFNNMVSQLEAAFTARAESEEILRESQERMRVFVADAAHELRTPLTAIRGFAQYARQISAAGTSATEELTALDRINQTADRMSLLVDDLLLLARLDETRPLESKAVDLLEVAADAVTEARLVDPGREVALDVRPDAAYHVTGDPVRLRQVIANLLSNALRHTPPGTPVTVLLSAEDGFGVLEVSDEGPGLTSEQAARVFDRFYRADVSRSRVHGGSGTGLGLAIVAGLVTAHGGEVTLHTAPGAGCTFRVRLPLA